MPYHELEKTTVGEFELSDHTYAPHTPVGYPEDPRELRPREHRRKAFKAGIISYQNHSLTVDCVIRDISSSGVKLQFQEGVTVPETAYSPTINKAVSFSDSSCNPSAQARAPAGS